MEKNQIEAREQETEITKVPIGIVKDTQPYFFIKWARNDKRYRVSASFKYLNTNYGLHINIIRDLNKESTINPPANKIKFLLSLLNNQDYNIISSTLKYVNYIDKDEETEIFFIKRSFNGEDNHVLVFFSLKYWSLNDYVNILKED